MKTIKYRMATTLQYAGRPTEMETEGKLMPTKEAVKKFVNDSDVISFGGLTAIDFGAHSKKIESNLASCVRGG